LVRSKETARRWTPWIRKNAKIIRLSGLYSRAESILPLMISEKALDIPEEGDGSPVISS